MNLFDRLLRGTGIVQEKGLQKEVVLRENIQFSTSFHNNYVNWKEQGSTKNLLSDLLENYRTKRSDPGQNSTMQLYEARNANGIYFKTGEYENIEGFGFLTYHLLQRLKGQHYILNQSIREVVDDQEVLKTNEIHYLKPSLKFRRITPYEQLFGNVQIEHRMIDGESELFKILATTYSDHLYAKPYDFEDLVGELFS